MPPTKRSISQNRPDEIALRQLSLPTSLETRIFSELARHHIDVHIPQDARQLSEAVLKLSDFYISNPKGATPWHHEWAQLAYISYYLPLGFLRVLAVVHEGRQLGFFNGLKSFIDFGSGPGTASLVLEDQFTHAHNIEISSPARELHRRISQKSNSNSWTFAGPEGFRGLRSTRLAAAENLSVFSYVLTEIGDLPSWALESEALMILEPSTRDDGRRLQALRRDLISSGFSIWAPCTHQEACPLLVHSERDWCHDRISWSVPEWFLEIERHLPIKNKTLTFSYLLARKSRPPGYLRSQARLVGDRQDERGKSIQMVCRGPEREFLSWLARNGEAPELPRGVRVVLPEVEIKGKELRPRGVVVLAESENASPK